MSAITKTLSYAVASRFETLPQQFSMKGCAPSSTGSVVQRGRP
jgi:hypothetical protein